MVLGDPWGSVAWDVPTQTLPGGVGIHGRTHLSMQRGQTLRFRGKFEVPLWILGSGPISTIPEAEIMVPILIFGPPRAGVRASMLYGVPHDLAAAVLDARIVGLL